MNKGFLNKLDQRLEKKLEKALKNTDAVTFLLLLHYKEILPRIVNYLNVCIIDDALIGGGGAFRTFEKITDILYKTFNDKLPSFEDINAVKHFVQSCKKMDIWLGIENRLRNKDSKTLEALEILLDLKKPNATEMVNISNRP